MGMPLMNGYTGGVAGRDTMEELAEVWDLETILLGVDPGNKFDERIPE